MKTLAFLLSLIAAVALAQDTPTHEDETRSGAWHFAVAIVGNIEKNDTADFPGVRGWLKDFHTVQEKVGDGDKAKPFPAVDSDALVTRNANWWAAYYEIAPGDPALLALHSLLLLAGGEPQRAQQLAAISTQRPGIPKLYRQALSTVLNESFKAMERSRAITNAGVQLHDEGDYDGAIKKYDEALVRNPANGWTHYERGFSIRIRALVKAGKPVPKNGQFTINDPDPEMPEEKEIAAAFKLARQHDPFQVNAYQGKDKKVIDAILPVREKLVPAWQLITSDLSKLQGDDTILQLAEGCDKAGIPDYALVARQIVIARRKRYAPEDHPILSANLRELAPGPAIERTIKQLAGEFMKGMMLVEPDGDSGPLCAPAPDPSAKEN